MPLKLHNLFLELCILVVPYVRNFIIFRSRKLITLLFSTSEVNCMFASKEFIKSNISSSLILGIQI